MRKSRVPQYLEDFSPVVEISIVWWLELEKGRREPLQTLQNFALNGQGDSVSLMPMVLERDIQQTFMCDGPVSKYRLYIFYSKKIKILITVPLKTQMENTYFNTSPRNQMPQQIILTMLKKKNICYFRFNFSFPWNIDLEILTKQRGLTDLRRHNPVCEWFCSEPALRPEGMGGYWGDEPGPLLNCCHPATDVGAAQGPRSCHLARWQYG